MGKISREVLHQHWVHAREEDTATEMVFRPAGFGFAPSRGREAFELKPDGRLVEYGIGPTDRRVITEGRWELTGDDRLTFLGTSPRAERRVRRILAASPDRLVIAKQPPEE
jgi:hypothetical protein